MSDLIEREDAVEVIKKNHYNIGGCGATLKEMIEQINAIPPADRPQGEWIDEAISIIDDMQREGIIDYQQAWEFRMRARMKGADDE